MDATAASRGFKGKCYKANQSHSVHAIAAGLSGGNGEDALPERLHPHIKVRTGKRPEPLPVMLDNVARMGGRLALTTQACAEGQRDRCHYNLPAVCSDFVAARRSLAKAAERQYGLIWLNNSRSSG